MHSAGVASSSSRTVTSSTVSNSPEDIDEQIVNIYLEFVECAIHQILYVRGLYPKIVFGRAFKYGIVVWQCRHAEINKFIQRVLANAKPLLQSGIIEKFTFVSFGKNGAVKDEVTVGVTLTSSTELQQQLQRHLNANDFVQCDVDFKVCLLRLLVHLENLPALAPETDTWTIQCQTFTDTHFNDSMGAKQKQAQTTGISVSSSAGSYSAGSRYNNSDSGMRLTQQRSVLEQALLSQEWLASDAETSGTGTPVAPPVPAPVPVSASAHVPAHVPAVPIPVIRPVYTVNNSVFQKFSIYSRQFN